MKTKPLDIVYNKAAFTKVKEIFSRKALYASRKTELNIAGRCMLDFKESVIQYLQLLSA